MLVIGLILSIALMGIAANYIARLLHRYPWIAYVGLAIILYVALDMIYGRWQSSKIGRSSALVRRRAMRLDHLCSLAAQAADRLDLHRVRPHLHELDAVAVGILDPALVVVVGGELGLDGQLDAGKRATPQRSLRGRSIPGKND